MGRWRVRFILLVLLSSSLSAVGLSLLAPRPNSPQDARLQAASPDKKAPPEDSLPPEVKPEKRPPPAKPAPGPIRLTRVMDPEDAARLAVLDATRPPDDPLRIDPSNLPFMRWVWVPRALYEDGQGVRFVINLDSRSAFLKQAPIVAGNYLVRINLAHYADKFKDQIRLIQVWEEFQYSPVFSRLITRDELGFLTKEQKAAAPKIKREKKVPKVVPAQTKVRKETRNIKVEKLPFITPDDRKKVFNNVEVGATYKWELEFDEVVVAEVTVVETVVEEISVLDADLDVIRFNSPGVPSLGALQNLTGSQAPIVELPYFVSRATTTIKDADKADKLFATVFGGLYYDLRGIDKVDKTQKGFENATDEDLFFERLGIGNIKAGVTAKKLFDDLNSSQRVAVFESDVTGKPRAVDLFNTPQNGDSSPFGGISHDVKDKNIDQTKRAMKNLLDFKDDAREGIFPGNNGMPLFWMGNGQGVRQDEVPFDVALDSTIPHPYSQRLQVIGCIRCHGADGSSVGWKPLANDAKELLSAYGVDAFADLSELNTAIPDTLAKLVKRYQWRNEKQLARARDDYSEKVLLATGLWKKSKDQSDMVTLASQKVGDIYASYWYTRVTPRVALAELGYDVADEAQAAQVLSVLLPPDKRGRVGEIIPEDANLAALKQYKPKKGIPRSDWALSYSFALERSIPNRPLVERMWLKP